jgi:predicted membrane-bound spermidine synthase
MSAFGVYLAMMKAVIFHRVSAVLWTLALIPALIFWKESIVFVIIASVYANVKSDWGAAEAADDHVVLDEIVALRAEFKSLNTRLVDSGVISDHEEVVGAARSDEITMGNGS